MKTIHNDVYVASLRKSQPHPEARPVFFDVPGRRTRKHVGWLMPQIGEVDEKTAKFYAAKAKRENARRDAEGRPA